VTRAARALAVAALGASLGAARPARAGGAALLDVTAESCPGLDLVRLRELLAIELATLRPVEAGDVDVHLVCEGERVTVELRDRARARSWHAEVDLAGTPPETRLRLLVLAVTEQWAREREEPHAPRAAPIAPASPLVIARTPEATPPEPVWRARAQATLRHAGRPGAWLAGAGIGIERQLRGPISLALDVSFEGGAVDTAVARIAVRDVAVILALPAGGSVGRWSLSLAPAFAVGFASLAATPRAPDARGSSLGAAWAGPLALARARRAIGRTGFVAAEAGVGVTTQRVTGLVDGQTALFELRGPWVAFGLGAGLAF
jgi:hypothetical protein